VSDIAPDLSVADASPVLETAPAVTEAPAAPVAPDDLPEVPADQAVFDRGYVVKLREEAAKHRTALRELEAKHSTFDEVFSGYEPEDVSTWLDLARTWANDPSAAAGMMRDIANAVLAEGGTPEQAVAAAEAVQDASEAEAKALTPQDVQRLVEERLSAIEAERAQEAGIQRVYAEAKELGFDPETRQGVMLLWTANNQTNGDLKAAAELIAQERQSIIEDYLRTKQPGYRVAASPASTAASPMVDNLRTLEDARKASDAFVAAHRFPEN
jgi:hypothetical protein